jgi:hypothetical protein
VEATRPTRPGRTLRRALVITIAGAALACGCGHAPVAPRAATTACEAHRLRPGLTEESFDATLTLQHHAKSFNGVNLTRPTGEMWTVRGEHSLWRALEKREVTVTVARDPQRSPDDQDVELLDVRLRDPQPSDPIVAILRTQTLCGTFDTTRPTDDDEYRGRFRDDAGVVHEVEAVPSERPSGRVRIEARALQRPPPITPDKTDLWVLDVARP